MPEEVQLLAGHAVLGRYSGAVRDGLEEGAAVAHGLTHELDRAVEPRAAARSAVRHGVRQVLAVVQDVTGAEGRDDLVLGRGHVVGVHLGAGIAARGDVGVVHLLVVQIGVRNDDDVVGRTLRITGAVEVVEVRDPVVHAADGPVVPDVEVLERPGADRCRLCRRERVAQVLATVEGVVKTRAVVGEDVGQIIQAVEALPVLADVSQQLVDRSDQAGLVFGLQGCDVTGREVSQG